jgi:hypothetical protein
MKYNFDAKLGHVKWVSDKIAIWDYPDKNYKDMHYYPYGLGNT